MGYRRQLAPRTHLENPSTKPNFRSRLAFQDKDHFGETLCGSKKSLSRRDRTIPLQIISIVGLPVYGLIIIRRGSCYSAGCKPHDMPPTEVADDWPLVHWGDHTVANPVPAATAPPRRASPPRDTYPYIRTIRCHLSRMPASIQPCSPPLRPSTGPLP
jgi:hypothetical protein